MQDKNRRDVIRYGAMAAGVGILPGGVAAQADSKKGRAEEPNINIENQRVIAEKADYQVGAVTVSNRHTEKQYFTKINKNTGGATVVEIEESTHQTATATTNEVALSMAEAELQSQTAESVVKKSEVWGGTNGSCDVYDHTHPKARISAELHEELDELGASAVIAALGQIIGSSSLAGPHAAVLMGALTIVIGGAAFLTDVTTFTIGAWEWDQGLIIHKQTMSSVKAGVGWDINMDDMIPVGASPGHPGRL